MRWRGACCVLAAMAAALLSPARAQALTLDTIGRVSADYVRHAAARGDYLFRGTQDAFGPGKLIVHDLSDPGAPELVAAVAVPFVNSLVVSPTLVVAGGYGLRVLDFTDPRAPVDCGTSALSQNPEGLALEGNALYVADLNEGLLVVDLSNPAAPRLLGKCEIDHYAQQVTIAGRYVVVSDLYDRLHIIDVADRTAPVEVGRWEADSIDAIAMAGRYVLVTGGSYLHVVDLRKAEAPREVASYLLGDGPFRVAVSGRLALFEGDSALLVLNITDPTSPTRRARLSTDGFGGIIAFSGDLVLLVGGVGEVLAIDLTRLQEAYEIPRLDPVVAGTRVAVADGYAYALGESLSVVDLRNPTAPVKVADRSVWEETGGSVIARGRYLYVTEGEMAGDFSIYDIASPDRPVQVGVLVVNIGGGTPHLALTGRYAYTSGGLELAVIDISDPSAPVQVGVCSPLPGSAGAVAVAGGYAYVCTNSATALQVIDVSDAQHPAVVGSLPLPGTLWAVALSGSRAFVACGAAGIQVVDISSPTVPTAVATIDVPATDLAVLGSYLYTDAGVVGLTDFGGGGPAEEEALTSSGFAFWEGNVISVGDELTVAQPLLTFGDTPLDYWALDAIERSAMAGIVTGYGDGDFGPELSVTRDQMAAYLARGLAGGDANVPADPDDTPFFPDVPADSWAYRYVEYCHDGGLVEGYADGYHPTEVVTRGQIAVYLARAAAGGEVNIPDDPDATPSFTDVPTASPFYKYVEYGHDHGLLQGYADGAYHPEATVTRAQLAVYVTRTFDLPE